MPNYCDCKLTITGPNRQAVLEKIKGEPWTHEKLEGEPVYFDMEKIIPMPPKVKSGDWREWAYKNWGCSCVYPDREYLNPNVKDENGKTIWSCLKDDAEVIIFTTPWSPPLYAIQALSTMFHENTFLLEDGGTDLPSGATLFRAGKSSNYFLLPRQNGNTGKTTTPYEVFLAVLRRTGSVVEALAEAGQGLEESSSKDEEQNHEQSHDPALDAEIRPLLQRYLITQEQVTADKALIAQQVTLMRGMSEKQIKSHAERMQEEHYEMVLSKKGEK